MVMRKIATKKSKSRVSYKRRYRYTNPALIKEKKHYDRFNTHSIISTGTLTLLTSVTAQGTDDNQRIGDVIYCTSLYIHLNLIRNTSSNYDNIRLIIFQDKMGYNTPVVNDIMEPGTMGGAYAPLGQFNHYFMSRFRILWDKTVSLSLNMGVTKTLQKSIRVNSKIEYVGAATFKNQIYLLTIGDNNNALQLPQINSVTRIIYTDS